MLKRPAILVLSLLFAAVLVLGLVHLFELRLDRGDIYPPYSTLRTDPLGTSIFYESLNAVPGVSAGRYFEETLKSDDGQAHALFVLGTESYSMAGMSRAEFDTLQRFVYNGGRVVIAYYPRVSEPWSARVWRTNENENASSDVKKHRHRHHQPAGDANAETPTNGASGPVQIQSTNNPGSTNVSPAAKQKSPRNARRRDKSVGQREDDDQPDDDLKTETLKYADLKKEWGFGFTFKNLGTNDNGEIQFPAAELAVPTRNLPAQLAVHTSLCFTNLTNGWTAIYQRDKNAPVIVERKFGAGTVVLVADSYPFSNEAMFKDRSATLLAWLLGSGRDVIFDEAHLGMVEQPGMATLMRRYQLHGLIFSLLLVAGLFVWKNSTSLVPPPAETQAEGGPVVVGRDSASGFVNLVRRSIAPADIINVCFAEWKKSATKLAAISPAQRRDLEQLVQQQAAIEPHRRKPVENYRVLSQILRRRK